MGNHLYINKSPPQKASSIHSIIHYKSLVNFIKMVINLQKILFQICTSIRFYNFRTAGQTIYIYIYLLKK